MGNTGRIPYSYSKRTGCTEQYAESIGTMHPGANSLAFSFFCDYIANAGK